MRKYGKLSTYSILNLLAAVVLAALAAVPAGALPPPLHGVRIIAHRGASGHAPENTMAAFEKAVELGAEMFELDVYRTLDGRIVVIHDADTERTTGVKNLITAMTLKQIKELDAGSWYGEEFKGEPIPLLGDVLEWASGTIQVNVEIKGSGCEERVVKMIEHFHMEDQVIVTSFHHEFLKTIREMNPDIRIGALVKDIESKKAIDKVIEDCNPDAINPRFLLVNKSIVDYAHEKGLAVNPYTINDPITMKRLIRAGVDGIITNYPEMLLEILEERAGDG